MPVALSTSVRSIGFRVRVDLRSQMFGTKRHGNMKTFFQVFQLGRLAVNRHRRFLRHFARDLAFLDFQNQLAFGRPSRQLLRLYRARKPGGPLER